MAWTTTRLCCPSRRASTQWLLLNGCNKTGIIPFYSQSVTLVLFMRDKRYDIIIYVFTFIVDHGRQKTLWSGSISFLVESLFGRFLDLWCSSNDSRNVLVSRLQFFHLLHLHCFVRSRSYRILDWTVCHVQGVWVRGHCFHRAAKETSHFPSLVSSCYCSRLHLACLQGSHC